MNSNNNNNEKKSGVSRMVALAVPVRGTSVMDEQSSKEFVAEKGKHKTDPTMMIKFKKAQANMAKKPK